MKPSVCENKGCSYHKPISNVSAPYVDMAENGEVRRVVRHLYRSKSSAHEFYLCDVCHNAVQMVLKPNVK